jgi:hypothetical protein
MATKKKTTKKTTKAKVPTKSQVTAPRKAATKKKATRKAAPRKAAPKKVARPQISAEDRYKMIEQAAYFLAEKQHFHGDPSAIWVQAEKEVDAQIAAASRG